VLGEEVRGGLLDGDHVSTLAGGGPDRESA
jgi:hypothetical protein